MEKPRKEKWNYNGEWFTFYWGWNFDISYEICGYFDPRHRITLHLLYCNLTIKLPFKSKYTDECDPPKYGIAYHNKTLWIYRGGKGNDNGGNKWWTFNMPWQLDWVRTSNLRKDGEWEHETKKNRKRFYLEGWDDILWKETHPYVYILYSGEIQNRLATIRLSEREWRQKWLKWTKLFAIVRKFIEIDFNQEVGEESGGWKGGCTGCSYEMKENETPLYALRRMELERKF